MTDQAIKWEKLEEKYFSLGMNEALRQVNEIKGETFRPDWNEAQRSDYAETPVWLFEKIGSYVYIHPRRFYDICVLKWDWKASVHFNGLTDHYPRRFIWGNIPYGQSATWIPLLFEKSLKEDLNIAFLAPSESLNTDLAKFISEGLC